MFDYEVAVGRGAGHAGPYDRDRPPLSRPYPRGMCAVCAVVRRAAGLGAARSPVPRRYHNLTSLHRPAGGSTCGCGCEGCVCALIDLLRLVSRSPCVAVSQCRPRGVG